MVHSTTKLVTLALVGVACLLWPRPVTGHARLWEPAGRSTMWRRGFKTPPNYDDNQLYCGGFHYQLSQGYKCGVCGDPYDGNRANEAGGVYATGTIAANYTQGQVVTFQVDVTANHKGFFEFKLCPVKDPKADKVTPECLDAHPVNMADGSGSRHELTYFGAKMFDVQVKLPDDLACEACVLQFRYHTGNNWGEDPDGTTCVGCGPQEEFYACADIRIEPGSGSSPSSTGSSPSSTASSPSSAASSPSSTASSSSSAASSSSSTGSSSSSSGSSGTGSGSSTAVPTEKSTEAPTTATVTGKQEGGVEIVGGSKGSGSSSSSSSQTNTSSSGTNGDMMVCKAKLPMPGLTKWCQLNCQMGNCPGSHCACSKQQYDHQEERPQGCRASGVFATVNGMDQWCVDNCPWQCPISMCTCSSNT